MHVANKSFRKHEIFAIGPHFLEKLLQKADLGTRDPHSVHFQ